MWAMFFAAGGMPSSHSALLVSGTLAVGLYHGFDNPLFGIAVAITMIVTHDASGVRRQAGMHAERINVLFEELLKGHIWDENDLKEVIGHTPLEVAGGIILGLLVAIVQWKVWP
jgi:acid phosphatase family membrane protein YuiD